MPFLRRAKPSRRPAVWTGYRIRHEGRRARSIPLRRPLFHCVLNFPNGGFLTSVIHGASPFGYAARWIF